MIPKDNFVKFISDNIKEFLPEEYRTAEIVVEEVTRINDKYLGLTLRREESEVVPCLNLDMYYEMYESGEELEEILTKMAEIIEMPSISIDIDILTNYEKAKEHLMLRVCNASRNKDHLESVVNTKIADLALTYGIAIESDLGFQIATIKNSMLEGWGLSIDQLHEDTVKSCTKNFPPVLLTMADMISPAGHTKNLFDEAKTDEKDSNITPFYMLTNSEQIQGASALFYPEIMEKAANIIGEDYTIIPSSTHEVLLIPDSTVQSLSDLRDMIKGANDMSGTVGADEILGYEPYHYDSKSKIFETAESFAIRTAKKEKLDVRISSAEDKLAKPVKTDKEREAINGKGESKAF